MSVSSHFQGYDVKKWLDEGTFAIVYRVIKLATGEERALKQVKLAQIEDDEQEMRRANEEVELMKKLPQNPNIVSIFESSKGSGFVLTLNDGAVITVPGTCLYLELEYCGGGNLRKQIVKAKTERKPFSEDRIVGWFLQLVDSLDFIHKNGVVHRDIKPQNILLTSDLSTVKIGDFGISKVTKTYNIMGTSEYMAPELLSSDVIEQGKSSYVPNSKEDVWSLGVVLFEMVALSLPYVGSKQFEIIREIDGGRRKQLPAGDSYSNGLLKLIDRLLTIQPNSRPSMPEVAADPFVVSEKKLAAVRLAHAAEIAKLREEIASFQIENETLKTQVTQTDSELARRIDEISTLETKLSQADAKLVKRNEVINGLKAKNDKAEEELAKLRGQLVSFQSDLSQLDEVRKENEQLKMQIRNQPTQKSGGFLAFLGFPSEKNKLSRTDNSALSSVLQQSLPFNSDQRPARIVKQLSEQDHKAWFDAARDGDVEQVKSFIQQGADANAKEENIANWTALHYAAVRGHVVLVNILLLEGRAGIHEKDSTGRTPLMFACASGDKETVQLLIKNGADINCKDESNDTPLIYAACFGKEEIVRLLAANPKLATLNHRGKWSKTALENAIEKPLPHVDGAAYDRIAAYLRSKSATTQN